MNATHTHACRCMPFCYWKHPDSTTHNKHNISVKYGISLRQQYFFLLFTAGPGDIFFSLFPAFVQLFQKNSSLVYRVRLSVTELQQLQQRLLSYQSNYALDIPKEKQREREEGGRLRLMLSLTKKI